MEAKIDLILELVLKNTEQIGVLTDKVEHLEARIEEVRSTLDAKIDTTREMLEARIDEVRSALDAKIEDTSDVLTSFIHHAEKRSVKNDQRINTLEKYRSQFSDRLTAAANV